MSHIFFHTLLTAVLMIRPPMHCHFVHYFSAENELQYSSNMAPGDNNSRADSFCTLAKQVSLARRAVTRPAAGLNVLALSEMIHNAIGYHAVTQNKVLAYQYHNITG